MPEKPSVLFICQPNSGRSRMAEVYLKKMAGEALQEGVA